MQLNTNHLSLNINKVQHAGTTLSAKLMLLSHEAKQEYTRMRALHNFGFSGEEQPWILSIAFEIKNGQAAAMQDLITAVMAQLEENGAAPFKYSLVVEGHRLVLGLSSPMAPTQLLPIPTEALTALQEELKVNQTLEVNVRLAASPKDVLSPESETGIIVNLLKGISLDVRLNLWRKVADVLAKSADNEALQVLLPMLSGIAPVLLLKIKGEIDIEVDQNMQEKLCEHPIIEPFMMNAATLISSITSVSDDEEEYSQHLSEKLPPFFIDIVKAFNDNLGDEV